MAMAICLFIVHINFLARELVYDAACDCVRSNDAQKQNNLKVKTSRADFLLLESDFFYPNAVSLLFLFQN